MATKLTAKKTPALVPLTGPGVKVSKRKLTPAAGAASVQSLSSVQVREIVKVVRPKLKIVRPWATLSARQPYVKDKADATFWQTGHVSGLGDEVNLGSSWAQPDAAITVSADTVPGKVYVAIVYGATTGVGAVMQFQTDSGSGETPVAKGKFNFPVALVDTDDDVYLKITLKPGTLPSGTVLAVYRIELWEAS